MIIKQIYTNCLSQASYYIESKGESIIIDPIRDIEGYDEFINKNNSELKFILETHFHADFISGHIELSNKYNVPIIFGPHADTNFNSINKEDGEIIILGDIQIKVIHTPGHTLESVCYLLFDEKSNQKALFTGDTLFIGDIGRPDLAVDNNLSVNDLASMLYDSLYDKIMKLDEEIIIYPAHGPGTQCGKNLSEETFSTLKEQKLSNYALMFNNKTDFVSSITKNLPPAPDYFRDSALLNKNGYKSHLYDFDSLLISDFNLFQDENINLIDTRDPILFSKQHVKNSINVPLNGRYAITAANILDVKKKLIIICNEGDENESITRL
ncbi:MAG: MBL fold metallo-hydrolase, partial [Bacteroidota bacterium]|nr:MBL fold metallo-hydrolase [Bacteroidota bacterium]